MREHMLPYLIGVFLLLQGCQTQQASSFETLGPVGPTANLVLNRGIQIPEIDYKNRPGRSLSHELLEINERGLLILARRKVVLITYDALKVYRYNGSRPVLRKKDTPDKIREKILNMDNKRLPILVRFPQGVSPKVLGALLDAYNQEALIVVER